MTSASEAVAKYIEVVVAARDRCTRSEDRHVYTKHLAAAAEMSAAASRGDFGHLRELLAAEDRNFGWGYLSGNEGALAEQAFQELKQRIGSLAGG